MNKPGSLIAHARAHSAPLPYPNFADSSIAILEVALRTAWIEAVADQQRYGVNFKTDIEDDISMVLVDVMSQLCATAGSPFEAFNEFFHVVIPDSVLITKAVPSSQSSTTLIKPKKKRPDFAFRPKVSPAGVNALYHAIFVEAKIIEPLKTMGWYVGTGLSRFTSGAYAWSMSQGIMLGYLRHPTQKLPNSLEGHFNLPGKRQQYSVLTNPKVCAFSQSELPMHDSSHGRDWVYLDTQKAPGPIQVFHLWLQV